MQVPEEKLALLEMLAPWPWEGSSSGLTGGPAVLGTSCDDGLSEVQSPVGAAALRLYLEDK